MARTAAGNRLLRGRRRRDCSPPSISGRRMPRRRRPRRLLRTARPATALPRPEVTAKIEPDRADRSGTAKDAATAETSLADRRAWPPRKLSLALQGGGSFAAFSWGVLDRLLEQPDCEFDAISGASAGAVNAVLLASGLVEGGRQRARARLQQFWARIMNDASFRSLMLVGGFSPAGSSVAFGPALRSGQFDPFDLDPLRQVLARDIDFSVLRDPRCPKLLIAATRVRDGQPRIFRNAEITADVVLASTCPPQVQHRRNRRRSLLGWRFRRQSPGGQAGAGVGGERGAGGSGHAGARQLCSDHHGGDRSPARPDHGQFGAQCRNRRAGMGARLQRRHQGVRCGSSGSRRKTRSTDWRSAAQSISGAAS